MLAETKNKFKVGDWCYCDFKHSQILEMEEDNVTSITTGYIQMSGNRLRCFPVTVTIKLISETIQALRTKLSAIEFNSLNMPDINQELCRRWNIACELAMQELPYGDELDLAENFAHGILDRVAEMKRTMIFDGIKLIR